MNKQEIKRKAIESAKGVVDGEIAKLKRSVIDQLEEKGKSVLNESVGAWAHKIACAIFPNEMGQIRQDEQQEFNEAAIHARALTVERVKELIGELRASWGMKEVHIR